MPQLPEDSYTSLSTLLHSSASAALNSSSSALTAIMNRYNIQKTLGGLLALGSAGSSQVIRTHETCSTTQYSCQTTYSNQNLCCFNYPGGQILQTQFWDTNPVAGPEKSWTIHGLWPDHCDGTYDANCDTSREYTNITQILQDGGASSTLSYMQTYWVSNSGTAESFWEHEWGKHGTCISTLETSCYTNYQPQEEVVDFFEKTVALFKTLDTYTILANAGITPSSTKTYTSAEILAALADGHDGHEPVIGCSSSTLDEVWYFFNVAGDVINGKYQAVDPDGSKSTCPTTGIKYPPKSGSGSGGSGTTTATAPTSTATGSFSGKGYLEVTSGGSADGCLISAGTWYTSGTCATFTATSVSGGFHLTSSKGNCGISSGAFTCGSGVTASTFTASGGKLAYNGATTFYASSAPSGSTQATVYTTSKSTSLTIGWTST